MRVALALALLVASTAACSLLLGLEAPEGTAPAPPAPLAPEAAAAPLDPCTHAAPPAPPARDDAPTTAVTAFWLGVRTASVGPSGAHGLDLDGVCTCNGGPGAAWDGGAACRPRTGASVACDDPGGVDDEGSRWLGASASFDGGRPDDELARAAARGEGTLLLRIEGYNGLADDLSVSVGLAISDGLYTNECNPALGADDAGAACAEGGRCLPSWRGCDRWHPLAGQVTLESGVLTPVRRATGYVRDGVLVVRAEGDLPLPVVPGSATSAVVSGALLVGRLEAAAPETAQAARRFRLRNAVLGGRAPLTGLLGSLHGAPIDAGRLCQAPDTFRAVAAEACRHADTLRAASLDMQPNVTCDAVSFGLAFDADLVDVDPTARPPKVVPDPCAGRALPPLEQLCPP